MSPRRFRIAFSFAGEQRAFVGKVAGILAKRLGKNVILYDKYHEAEFAHARLGMKLPQLYRDESDLIVVVFCPYYNDKLWTGWEWSAIHDLINSRDVHRVMLTRFGLVNPYGLSNDSSFVELDQKTPRVLANLILKRLADNESEPSKSACNQSRPHEVPQPAHSPRSRSGLLKTGVAVTAITFLAIVVGATWPRSNTQDNDVSTQHPKASARQHSHRDFELLEDIRSARCDALFNSYLDDPTMDDRTRSAIESLRHQYNLLTVKIEEANNEGNLIALSEALKARVLLLYHDPVSRIAPAKLVKDLRTLGYPIEGGSVGKSPLTWDNSSAEDTCLECCDEIDNDGDTLVDGSDPDCLPFNEIIDELREFVTANDGFDNDGDGLIDAADSDLDKGSHKMAEDLDGYKVEVEGGRKKGPKGDSAEGP